MGRSSRLAIGSIAAALAAEQVATSHLAAAVALAMAALLLVGEARPLSQARSLWPIVIGAGLIAARLALLPADPALAVPPDGTGPWTLIVETTGSPRDGQQTGTLATPVGIAPSFRVAATLPRYPIVVPGDRVVVEGPIRPRPDSPYGTYLERIGAVGTLTSRSLTVEPGPADLRRHLEDLRQGAAEVLAQVLPEPEAGLAAGILIGLRDRVDRDLAAAFTAAGVSHVVAISGWNIAIVAAAIAAMTGRLGRRRRSVVTIIAIVAYVAFAGASASVVRAALMAGVVLLARESGRAGRATAALGWAATLLLVADPKLIGDAGFQLSSLATAGLIAWATPLTGWIETVGRGRLPHWLAESLGVSLAAQAATLPIILVSFGRLALFSPLVNLLVVPLVAPAMAVGMLALVAGGIVAAGGPPVLGAVLAAPGWVILRLLVGIVEAAAALPFATVTLEPPFDAVAAIGSVVALIALIHWRKRRREPQGTTPKPPARAANAVVHPQTGRLARRAAIGALLISVAVAGAVVVVRPTAVARVTILDVGQGDAILVEGARGGRLLVDGGPDPDRLLVALDRRIPPWDRRIDVVILSHPHEDHVAGLALLLERYHVARVFEPGMRGPGPGYAAWLRELARPNGPIRLGLAAGDRLAVDEIGLRVLWPIRGQVPTVPPDGGTGINNVSVVLLGQVGSRRFLLMGDVEQEIDPSLLADGLPRVDLLKVAHHGSRTATTEAFVEAVRPRVAVASAGAGNPYGHPTRATMDRLAAAGAQVLRTDRDGTVVVTFQSDVMSVRTEGGRAVSTPATPVAARSDATVGARFRCAIPVTAIVPEREPSPSASGVDPGTDRTVGYHRSDDGAWARGRGLPPALPRSPGLVRAARVRRGRGGRLARCTYRGAGCHAGSTARGSCGFASRHRQGPAGEPSGSRAPPRRGIRSVADRSRPSGTGEGGGEPPDDPPSRRKTLPTLGGVRVARGAARRLRGQTGRPTPRIDGGAIRLLAPTLSTSRACRGRRDRLGRDGDALRPDPGGAS